MWMATWIGLLLPSLAQSLVTSRWHSNTDPTQRTDGLCDREALYHAHLAGNDWRALKGNPCISEQIYKELESGERDPADNGEFLGNIDMPDLASVDVVPEKVEISPYSMHHQTIFPKVQFLGLPHSGSTSLASQMNLHPQLTYGIQKEHRMIFNLGAYPPDFLWEAYKSTFVLFDSAATGDQSNVKYSFDASPETMFIGCRDDERMKELPVGKSFGGGVNAVEAVSEFLGNDTKYIVMLRDPIDWVISDCANPKEPITLNRLLHGIGMDVLRSCYADCIEAWLEVIDKSNILFLDSSEYFSNPQETLSKIFDFLGLEAKTYTEEELAIHAGRRRARAMEASFPASDRTIYWQNSHVKECKARLEMLTQREWPWES